MTVLLDWLAEIFNQINPVIVQDSWRFLKVFPSNVSLVALSSNQSTNPLNAMQVLEESPS